MTDHLKRLHDVLAKELYDRVKDGEASASVLKEAREFLKDNGMQDARKVGPTARLGRTLPLTDPDCEQPLEVPFPAQEGPEMTA